MTSNELGRCVQDEQRTGQGGSSPQDRYKRGVNLPYRAVCDAQAVVGAVREYGPEAVAEILTGLTRNDLYALTVTLAAMLPDDYTPAELLAWNDHRYETRLRVIA